MNLYDIANEMFMTNNSEMSRGIKNQISILPAISDGDFEEKVRLLKEADIQAFTYQGIRALEFSLDQIKEVLSNNSNKEHYKTNPQELIRDLRKLEKTVSGSSLENDFAGGM